jgi:putative oxidoreductase
MDERATFGFDALQTGMAVLFLMAGLPKLLGSHRARAMFDHLRVPQQLLVIVGTVETAVALGLLIGFRNHAISVVAALVACPPMLGAMLTNIMRSRRREAWMPTGMLLFLCVLLVYVRWGSGS